MDILIDISNAQLVYFVDCPVEIESSSMYQEVIVVVAAAAAAEHYYLEAHERIAQKLDWKTD
jgi:hypothetical protein